MSQSRQLVRQWQLLQLLGQRQLGVTLKEMSEEMELSTKTIRRDLSQLQEAGFSIVEEVHPHGLKRWRNKSSFDGNLSFNSSELLALFLCRRLLDPLAGTVYWQSAQSAFRKIRVTLTNEKLSYFESLTDLLRVTRFRGSRYEDKAWLIDDLFVAVEDRRMTFITYQSQRSTEPLTYDIYPYGIIYHRGSLYLIAMSQQHGMIRTFKLDRISDVQLEELRFQRPPDFDLEEFLGSSLGIMQEDGPAQEIIIRFHPDVRQYVEEHFWHPSFRLTREKDGWLKACMELTGTTELKSWLLSFGRKAIVVSPHELREEIAAELEATLSSYRPSRLSPR